MMEEVGELFNGVDNYMVDYGIFVIDWMID